MRVILGSAVAAMLALSCLLMAIGQVGLLLGAVGARTGGADVVRGTARVTFWGALAMAITAGIGAIFGTVI
jgi:VIT1/CCC1 family predicted Fe2+/Mn2+ transporter